MDIFLNDFSFSCRENLQNNWQAITRFGQLIRQLKEYDIDKVIFPKGYKKIPLGDIRLSECYTTMRKLSHDQRIELISLMDSSIREMNEEETKTIAQFSEDITFNSSSKLIAKAIEIGYPVISFTFLEKYVHNLLEGYYRTDNTSACQKKSINNLYDASSIVLTSLISFKKCELIKAEENPLWNNLMVKKYIHAINHKDDIHFTTTEEKQAYLIKHGTIIAQINGWEEIKNISRKNSSSSKIRKIFYSKMFKHKNSYLCIDMEHNDIRFELCNHRGKHLGEYKYTGEKKGEASISHNIII